MAFLGLLVLYVAIPIVVTGSIVSLMAGVLAALAAQTGEQFMPTVIRSFVGAVIGGIIASAACFAFIGINAYVLNNLAYRGQGMGYALIFVPLSTVVGSGVGGCLAPLFAPLFRRRRR